MHTRLRFSSTPIHLKPILNSATRIRYSSTLTPIASPPIPPPIDYGFASTSKLTIEQIKSLPIPPLISQATFDAKSRPIPPSASPSSSKKYKNSRIKFIHRLSINPRQKSEILRRGGSQFWEKQRLLRLEKMSDSTAVESSGVPSSPIELLGVMQRLRRTTPPTSLLKIVEIHSHDSMKLLASTKSYAFLLRLAFKLSNLSLVRQLLQEMEERGILKDEIICEAMLYGYIKRGDQVGMNQMRQLIAQSGFKKEGGLDFWRERRDLGEKASGIGDPYKSFGRSGWGTIKPIVIPLKKLRTKQVKEREQERKDLLARPEIIIPSNVKELDGQTVIRLVDSLVHSRRPGEAFAVVETWLDFNKPITKINSSTTGFPLTPEPFINYVPGPVYIQLRRPITRASIRTLSRARNRKKKILMSKNIIIATATMQQIDLFNSRALILMNILLKALLMNYTPPFGCQAFIFEFIKRHSLVGASGGGMKPDIITLRELLMNLRGRKNGFKRGIEVIDWFEGEFGTNFAESSFARRDRSSRSWSSIIRSRVIKQEGEKSILPNQKLSLKLSLILLNYAIHQHKFLTKNSIAQTNHKKEFLDWWNFTLVMQSKGSKLETGAAGEEGWSERSTLDLLRKGRKCGLLD